MLLRKRFSTLFAQKCQVKHNIWKVLLIEFRRYLLDYAEAKKFEFMSQFDNSFEQAGKYRKSKDTRTF